jgi:hypothetical protein
MRGSVEIVELDCNRTQKKMSSGAWPYAALHCQMITVMKPVEATRRLIQKPTVHVQRL